MAEIDRSSNKIAPFILTLHNIVTNEAEGVIRWSANGDNIEISDSRKLARDVLPKYFRHSNYASFQRQLNYFGFRKRHRHLANVSTYYHPKFKRDKTLDLSRITKAGSPSDDALPPMPTMLETYTTKPFTSPSSPLLDPFAMEKTEFPASMHPEFVPQYLPEFDDTFLTSEENNLLDEVARDAVWNDH